MKKLVIMGKVATVTPEEVKKNNVELWMCGTDVREGADLYFELHGLPCKHSNVQREVDPEVYSFGLPINNSISVMLMTAYLKGYKKIDILGSPLDANHEYLKQRPALACVVGFLMAKGLKVNWVDMPENENYGAKG